LEEVAHTDTQTHIDTQQGGLKSLLLFLQNEESRLKMESLNNEKPHSVILLYILLRYYIFSFQFQKPAIAHPVNKLPDFMKPERPFPCRQQAIT
jgi:hypothetical protein